MRVTAQVIRCIATIFLATVSLPVSSAATSAARIQPGALFEQNVGQYKTDVLYRARFPGYVRGNVMKTDADFGRHWRMYLAAVALAAISSLAACGLMPPYGGSTQRWRVLDPSTTPPTPIPGAAVLVTYEGTAFAPGHSSTACVAAVLVKSDEQGYFEVPEPQGGTRVRTAPYKPNHAAPDVGPTAKGREVYLRPNPSTQSHLRHFHSLFAETLCSQLVQGSSAIVQFIEGLLPELSTLRGTAEGAKRFDFFNDVLERRRKAALSERGG